MGGVRPRPSSGSTRSCGRTRCASRVPVAPKIADGGMRLYDDDGNHRDGHRPDTRGSSTSSRRRSPTTTNSTDDFEEDLARDGWFHTGDLARRRSDGYVFIVDRKKDMIISGGFNIYAVEVEAVLHQHPDIYEAAVFGIPSDDWVKCARRDRRAQGAELDEAFVTTHAGRASPATRCHARSRGWTRSPRPDRARSETPSSDNRSGRTARAMSEALGGGEHRWASSRSSGGRTSASRR